MLLIDTHAHLFSEAFDADRKEVIERALDRNINKLLLPNIDETTIELTIGLANEHPETCFAMGGLHPTSVHANYKEQLQRLFSSFTPAQIVAVGEIGMDLYWDRTQKKEQTEAFIWQVEYAKKYNLPVVIHVREAFEETFQTLEPLLDGNLTGVFHSFTGTLDQAHKIISWGFKIGVGGIVTFKNAGVDKVIQEIALEHILLETDSPYLAPTPMRGKRNESSYLHYIAKKMGELHQLSVEEIAQITTQNAEQLFQLTHE